MGEDLPFDVREDHIGSVLQGSGMFVEQPGQRACAVRFGARHFEPVIATRSTRTGVRGTSTLRAWSELSESFGAEDTWSDHLP